MTQQTTSTDTPVQNESLDTQVLRHHNRELRILTTIAGTLNASVDLDSLLESALTQVADLLDLETGWVLLLDEDTGEPYLAAALNLPPGLATEPERMSGWCYCLNTYCQGGLQDASNVNIVTCSRLKQLVSERDGRGTNGLRFHASIPLRARKGKTQCHHLGMLNVASSQWRRLSDDELRLLHTIGDLLSVAIERAHLHARSLQAAQVKERNRLARDMHDTLAQGLSAITLQLESAEALLEQEAEHDRVQRPINTALALTRKSLDEARRSVLDLRAAPLEGRTLTEALHALVEERMQTEPTTTITFEPPHDRRPLSARVEIGLYRIAQEALTNAQQHAAAENITLCLDVTPDEVHLTVEDDGVGFDVDQLQEEGDTGHFGLIGLRERAHLLGGQLCVKSCPGTGTYVEASVPLTSAEPLATERATRTSPPNDDSASNNG